MRQSHPCPIPPSPTGSPVWRRISGPPPPRRPDRSSWSLRPAAARRRRSSRASPGSSTAASIRARSPCVAFNKRAAEELTERLDAALAPLGCGSGAARVRTFHALGREILLDAGRLDRPAHRPRRAPAVALPGGIHRGAWSPRSRLLAPEAGPPRDGGRGRRRPGAGAGRPGIRRLRARDPGVGRRRLRRPAGSGCRVSHGRSGAARPVAGADRDPPGR